jgi:hypothetical protein
MMRSEASGQLSADMNSNGATAIRPRLSRGALTDTEASQESSLVESQGQDEDVEIFPIFDELWPTHLVEPEKKISVTTAHPVVLVSSDSISELKSSVSASGNLTHKTYANEHVFYKVDDSKMAPGLEVHTLDFNGGCSHAINKVVKILKVNKAALDSPDGKEFLKDLGARGEGMLKMCQRIVNFFTTMDTIPSHEILTIDDVDALVQCETKQQQAKVEEPGTYPKDVTLVQGDMADCTIQYPAGAQNGLSQTGGKSFDVPKPDWRKGKVAKDSQKESPSLAELGSNSTSDAESEGVAVTWLDGKISYCFHSSVDDVTKSAVRIAIKRVASKIPCIQIREMDVSPANADTCESIPSIIVRSDSTGCWSYIGQVSKKMGCKPKDFSQLAQTMNLGMGCGFVGTVEHQLGHALGLTHENTRHDRDRYVHFKKEHLNKAVFDQQFPIAATDYNETTYDYFSIMHPGPFAFSLDTMETVVPRDLQLTRDIGQREGFSQYDIEHLAELYGCLHGAHIGLTNVALEDALNTPPDEANCLDSFPSGIASVSTGDDIPCKDLFERCNHADVGIMVRMACPKTCQVCYHPSTTPQPSTMTGGGSKWHCEDSLDNPKFGSYGAKTHGEQQCPGLKKYCETHMDVRLKCQKTCGNCPRCEDSSPGYQIMKNGVQKEATCKDLADVGKCSDKKYGGDIQTKCPASCKLCKPTPPGEAQKPCHDVANTHLTIDNKPATCMQLEKYCQSDGWGEEIRDLCPQTCKVQCVNSQAHGSAGCQDQWDSGFKLSSGHMASCKTLGNMKMCYNKEYGARIRENCPATCRVCAKHGGTGHLEGCIDKVDTGISLFNKPANCDDLAIFCQHPNEVTENFSDLLLDVQRTCPKTCDTCSAVDPYMKGLGNVGGGGACTDNGPVRQALGNSETGQMDLSCKQVAKYQWCYHFSEYEQKYMHQICPHSCNSCHDDASGVDQSCFDHEDTQFYFDGADSAATCTDLKNYCAHPKHGQQVRQVCCKMCSDCADEPEKLNLKVQDMLGRLTNATCEDLHRYCYQNATHTDLINERCASTCKTCFNRRRRSRSVTVIGY